MTIPGPYTTETLEQNLRNVIGGWEYALKHPSNTPDTEWKKGWITGVESLLEELKEILSPQT